MKKTRLLEIIREEIQIALKERPMVDGPADVGIGDDGKLTKKPLKNALEDAIDAIKKEDPTADIKKITSILTKKGSRTSEETSSEVKEKLKKVDDAIDSQERLFGVDTAPELLKKYTNLPKDDPEYLELSNTITKFIDKEKEFSDNLQSNQTSKFVKKTLEKSSTPEKELSDEEKEIEAAVGTDSTAQELAKTSDDDIKTFNKGLVFIKKYKDDKPVIDAYLKKAKEEYKLPNKMLDDLKLAAGRKVE